MKPKTSLALLAVVAIGLGIFGLSSPDNSPPPKPLANCHQAVTVQLDEPSDEVQPYELPDDCELIATIAYERIRATGCWVRIMEFQALYKGDLIGHAVVVWQPFPGSHILLFDEAMVRGTATLGTTSHDPKDIITDLNKHLAGMVILDARYLD